MLQTVTGQEIQLHPRVLLLFDFDKDYRNKELLANMLAAANLLIAQRWKTGEVPSLDEWLLKVCHLCLLNKLSAACRYRMGSAHALKNNSLHWDCFLASRYTRCQVLDTNECVLTML